MVKISGTFSGDFFPESSGEGGCFAYLVIILFIVLGITGIKDCGKDVTKKQSPNRARQEYNYFDKERKDFPKAGKIEGSSPSVKSRSPIIEDYNVFVNTAIINDINSIDISVLIVDESGEISPSVSSEIADLYTKDGYTGSSGLIYSSFTQYDEFENLLNADPSIISKLNLRNHIDFLLVGKMDISYKQSELVENTIVSTIVLSANIISITDASVTKKFEIKSADNGASESQAKRKAIRKLMQKYSTSNLSL